MARLFIAIRFDNEFKKKLVEIQESLKLQGVNGNYCSYGNLHMTLAFIGETRTESAMHAIRKAVSEVPFEPFQLTLDRLDSFPTNNGVIWCGVKGASSVTTLTGHLRERLRENGVSFRQTLFVPHISLVQHPSHIITDIPLPEAAFRVECINIMKSERIDGELVYSEI